MSAQGYPLEVVEESKEPVCDLSGGHVHASSSHVYQQNPAYNVVPPEAGRGTTVTSPPEYEELSSDGPPVHMVMSTPNVVCLLEKMHHSFMHSAFFLIILCRYKLFYKGRPVDQLLSQVNPTILDHTATGSLFCSLLLCVEF